MKKEHHILAVALFCIYVTAVAVLCLMKTDSFPDIGRNWLGIPVDKIAHFCMFLPYFPLAWMAFAAHKTGTGKWVAFVLILASGMAAAALTEVLQSSTEYRSGEAMDFLADMTGIVAGALTIIIFRIRKQVSAK